MSAPRRPALLAALFLPLLAAAQPGLTPRETVARFDSLLRAGAVEEARALCAGQALRLFPLLVQAQARIAPHLDASGSRDTVLEEVRAGDWAALRIRSEAVFTRPLMGLDRLASVQAVHLYRERSGWKIAGFEELHDVSSPLVLRSGVPSAADAAAAPLPVSRLAPERLDVTRMRLAVSLRSGDSLPPLPEGPGQRVLRRGRNWALIETSVAPLSSSARGGSAGAAPVHLASTPDLDLEDPLLRAKAAELRKGSPNDVETARRIQRFVSGSFRYRLGAALFQNSRQALRDLEGDCSEAALLTAALLRAAGIPSQVVLGFATLGRGAFIGHAWAEARLNGEWIGVDAALREFPAGAARVALARLDGAEPMQAAASNVLLRALGDLDVQIQEAWAGQERVALAEQKDGQRAAREFLDRALGGWGD